MNFSEFWFLQKASEGMAKTGENSFEDEIMESDIELEGEVVEPDNDPPQKVRIWVKSPLTLIEP